MFSHQYITTPIYSPSIHATPLTYTTHTVTTTPTAIAYHNYNNNDDFYNFYNDYGVSYVHIEPKKLENIPYIGKKLISRGSYDTITHEEIKNNDILIDFKRDHKTEYEYDTFYKESSLETLLTIGKNQFTLLPLDVGSIVKFIADVT